MKLFAALLRSALLSAPLTLQALDSSPWFGPDKLPQVEAAYAFRHASKLDNSGQAASHLFSFAAALSPDPLWSFEAGLLATEREARHFSLDSTRFAARYLFADGLVGAPVSASLGLCLERATEGGAKDPLTPHAGKMNYELQLSIGKEASCGFLWQRRAWLLAAAGVADRGSPWLRLELNWKRARGERLFYGWKAEGAWGLGGSSLKPERFCGYGPIARRSLDLLLFGSCDFLERGAVTLEYRGRVLASNCPKGLHEVRLAWLFPFAL